MNDVRRCQYCRRKLEPREIAMCSGCSKRMDVEAATKFYRVERSTHSHFSDDGYLKLLSPDALARLRKFREDR